MTDFIDDLLKENDLIIITGNDYKVYGRAKFDENGRTFLFISDDKYNKNLSDDAKDFLLWNVDESTVSYILEDFENVTIDIYRQTSESRMGKRILFVNKGRG